MGQETSKVTLVEVRDSFGKSTPQEHFITNDIFPPWANVE
jgi:hypothetical protein